MEEPLVRALWRREVGQQAAGALTRRTLVCAPRPRVHISITE